MAAYRSAAVAAFLLLRPLGISNLPAQAPASRFSGGVSGGLAVYDGRAHESGLGVLGRAFGEYRPASSPIAMRAEASVHRYAAVGQTCTTSIPAACYPESPPRRLWSAGLHFVYPINGGSGGFFLSGGAGVYSRSASKSTGAAATAGGEAGVGVAIRGRGAVVLLEARYIAIGSGRTRAGAWPVTLGLLF